MRGRSRPPAGRVVAAGDRAVAAAGRAVAADERRRMPGDAGPGGDWVRSLATDTPADAVGPGGAAVGVGGSGRVYPDHPSWPAPAVHHDPAPGRPVPQVPPARGRHVRVPAGYSGRPGQDGAGDDTQQRWSAQLARTTGPIPQTYYDLAFGDGRLQVVLTEAPGTNQEWGTPTATNVLQLTGPDPGQQGAVGWQGADPGNADAVRLARRILSDADQQAAEIRLEAAAQAAAMREAAEREAVQIREQTAAETAPIREGAEREAAEIKELAAVQAAAIREAAERGAAELRTHLLAMSAELARVAAYVTENLASPPQPGVRTISVPVLEPGAEPAAKPGARPGTAPRTRPTARQRWFVPLRRWYGVTFAITAFTDATAAAITTNFAGGVFGRLAGHSFLLVGFTMVVLLVPLFLTGNNFAQRWLGRYWKVLRKLTYLIWGLLFLHLALLEGLGFQHGTNGPSNAVDGNPVMHQRLYQLTGCSIFLLVFRLPRVKRWVAEKQRAGQEWKVYLTVVPLAALFVLTFAFMLNEEITKGTGAFALHASDD